MSWPGGSLHNGLLVLHTVLPILLASSVSSENDIPDHCDVCRIVASGFLKGLKKTEASHFAGGNTDWEDKHLGKYAESETRFIEILEMACPEKYDHPGMSVKKTEAKCHSMIEQQEELLEKWFYRLRISIPDLFQWLCIDQMKVCCPRNRFGPECTSCPGDTSRPCFGNGACHGSGTRFGTGKCVCHAGYQGKLCRKCAHNYYAVHENQTHSVTMLVKAVVKRVVPTAARIASLVGVWFPAKDVKVILFLFLLAYRWKIVTPIGNTQLTELDFVWAYRSSPKQSQRILVLQNDIDECESSPCSASTFERCENTPGSYKCECVEAFRREDGICIPDPDVIMNDPRYSQDRSSVGVTSNDMKQLRPDVVDEFIISIKRKLSYQARDVYDLIIAIIAENDMYNHDELCVT
ncbi:hypothetical protein M514_00186, partial [Trichuris suis]